MDRDIPITKHIRGDVCWVCKRPFNHSLTHEDHHIVPCAYGGTDGPQVRICSPHHTSLHTIALRLYSGKPYFDLLPSPLTPFNSGVQERLLYLASVAYNARVAVENDPNKKRVLVLRLTRETNERLDKLKQIYRKIGRERLVEIALKELFNKHFR